MSDTVLKVEGLYKKFCMSLKRRILYGTFKVTKDMLGFPYKQVRLRKSGFWAIEGINTYVI